MNREKDIQIEIAVQSFKAKKSIDKFSKKDGFYYAYKSKPIWGTDGKLPNSAYKFIRVKIRDKEVEVPQKSLENLFQPNYYRESKRF